MSHMDDLPYVSELARQTSRKMEAKFSSLPPGAGVIFVGVTAEKALQGKSVVFTVRLGMSRLYEKATGEALIRDVLRDEIASGAFTINASVYLGVPGASCAQPVEGHGPAAP